MIPHDNLTDFCSSAFVATPVELLKGTPPGFLSVRILAQYVISKPAVTIAKIFFRSPI